MDLIQRIYIRGTQSTVLRFGFDLWFRSSNVREPIFTLSAPLMSEVCCQRNYMGFEKFLICTCHHREYY